MIPFARIFFLLIANFTWLGLSGQNAPEAPNPTTIRTKLIIATVVIVLVTGYTIMKAIRNKKDQ